MELSNENSQSLAISVSDFFQQINWSGVELAENDGGDTIDAPYETVGQFFATFPWQGTMTVTPEDWELIDDDEIMPAVDADALTLDDLSALF
ncbi:hypothetical protein IQ260_15785 [Leptolyngbya cf. ectocarpi LEGE 11479]|uniref:Uncharacterized protein n=1 Tax=Leptolyngbya cf. ectocarpi LEGE 11479 TaxID=1828722 RepID=A0A928ZVA1_LEPEC|nr:hypothetical protein [Leptolyngbya ectocarpi]MBE9068113.1 hypothetical protein [Leptolyngbya cf. ectocarpi LEGE 11479]